MRKAITQAVVAELKPGNYTVFDRTERGLALRVLPSGVKCWRVRLKTRDDVWYWWKLGSDALVPEKARTQAHLAKARSDAGEDLRETQRRRTRDTARQITLRTFITDTYRSWAEANQKRGHETIATLEGRCADFLDVPMSAITPFMVERWRGAYLKRGRKPSTANRVLQALKACLARAVAWHFLDQHPLTGFKLARVDAIGRLRYLSSDEERRLRAALDARDEKRRAARLHHNDWCRARGLPVWPLYGTYTDLLMPLVILLLHTGLRFGEASALAWGDVDLVGALLTVRGDTSKSAKTRYLPLNTTVLDTMKAWKPEHVDAGAFVFPGKDGARLTDIKTSWKHLLTTVQGAPIVGFRVHDLRHTFASKLVQAGVDLNTVRELLGHADIKMTLRYSHLAPEHRAAAVAKLVKAG